MSARSFHRLSGAGNDFLALVEPPREPSAERIRRWCRRGVSLGADGVLVLRRIPNGARLVHFNADGGRSELCLNGSRCAARLLFELGWERRSAELETDVGALEATIDDEGQVELLLPDDLVGEPRSLDLVLGDARYSGFSLRVGVPHFVLPVPDSLASAPVEELGPGLREHPRLDDEGANVDFVRWVRTDRFEIRTWERGVEAETAACGSGVVAAAVAGVWSTRLELPVSALTAGGFELRVSGTSPSALRLSGDARIVARGEITEDAEWIPEPVRWS